jgi:hypothetical protein
MKIIATAAAALALPLLSSCASAPKPAWAHYDDCATETSSFQQMVACGKQRRLA